MSDAEKFKLVVLHWRLKYGIDKKVLTLINRTALFDLQDNLVEITLPTGFSCPEELKEFHSLRTLRLRGAVITEDAIDTIEKLNSLRNLSIRECKINNIERIFSLDYLTWLDISFCGIKTVRITKMMQLRNLLLAGNNIRRIPPVGKYLPELRRLVLTFNPIEVVGEEILDYTALEKLILWSTNVRKITDKIWGKLKAIDLTNTPLGYFIIEKSIQGTKIIRTREERYG